MPLPEPWRRLFRVLCTHKITIMIAGARTPITSLQYFSDVIEEVTDSSIPESYWEPLRWKVAKMEKQWQRAHPASP